VIVLTGVNEDLKEYSESSTGHPTRGTLLESCDLDHEADEDTILEKAINPDEFVETIRSFENFQLAIIRAD